MDYGLVRAVLILLLLLPPAYWDLRTREIEPKYWVLAGVIVAFSSLISYKDILAWDHRLLMVYIITSLLVLGVLTISYLAGIMGGADLFALAMISIGVPESYMGSVLGIPFLTLLYASLASMVLPVSFCIGNIIKYRRHLRNRPKILCLLGLPFTAERLSKNPGFWFPLEIYDEDGNKKIRFSFNVEEEPEDIRRQFKKLLDKGILNKDDIIYSTPGIPFIIFIVIGYIIGILFGDTPITTFLGVIT
ncbi:MAG: hypothetical protein F7C32_04270 [Desulfurococcales archaeon]|nr:hypothetical protein [Desulfurococcales archaeon]